MAETQRIIQNDDEVFQDIDRNDLGSRGMKVLIEKCAVLNLGGPGEVPPEAKGRRVTATASEAGVAVDEVVGGTTNEVSDGGLPKKKMRPRKHFVEGRKFLANVVCNKVFAAGGPRCFGGAGRCMGRRAKGR